MSDEPNPNELSADDWVMPEPTFRSSEGFTPGKGRSEAITGEIKSSVADPSDEMSNAITEEMPVYEEKKGGSSSFMMVVGIIILLAALAAAVYYLAFPTQVDTTF